MNNTKTTTLAIAAVLAATLVVGIFAATTTIPSAAFAYKKGEGDKGNNGNTVTIQKNKQDPSQSGFDNSFEQEAQNIICTHPGNNATCSQEGVISVPTTGTLLVKKVEKCVLKFCPVLSDFKITVTGNKPTPSTFDASLDGTLVTLGPGAFSVKETTSVKGFTTTFSADCSGTIAAGDHKTCTVTNTQQVP